MGRQSEYMVSAVTGGPNFDSLPVAKITNYPLEPRDYKPFAQSVLCVGGDRLYLRMWAFEVSPPPASALACVLYLFPEQPERALLLRIEHGQPHGIEVRVSLLRGGEEEPEPAGWGDLTGAMERHALAGEDLQGVYWGGTVSLPIPPLKEICGDLGLTPGDVILGNFYKLCEQGQFAHQGSLFPALFPHRPFAVESMGRFRIVSY